MADKSKPIWWAPGIPAKGGGCLCCPGTVEKLPMNTRIYNGFGGWTITKDRQLIYMGDSNLDWEKYPTLMKFENMARKEPDSEWTAELMIPLRNASYQRHGKNTWVLVDQGQGFA